MSAGSMISILSISALRSTPPPLLPACVHAGAGRAWRQGPLSSGTIHPCGGPVVGRRNAQCRPAFAVR